MAIHGKKMITAGFVYWQPRPYGHKKNIVYERTCDLIEKWLRELAHKYARKGLLYIGGDLNDGLGNKKCDIKKQNEEDGLIDGAEPADEHYAPEPLMAWCRRCGVRVDTNFFLMDPTCHSAKGKGP